METFTVQIDSDAGPTVNIRVRAHPGTDLDYMVDDYYQINDDGTRGRDVFSPLEDRLIESAVDYYYTTTKPEAAEWSDRCVIRYPK